MSSPRPHCSPPRAVRAATFLVDASAVLAGCSSSTATTSAATDVGSTVIVAMGDSDDGRLATVATGLDGALTAVRSVMRTVGYAHDGYQLVVRSYGSPFSEKIDPATQTLAGCPLRTSAVPALSTAVQASATKAGAHFVDLSTSMAGHQARGGARIPAASGRTAWPARPAPGAVFHPTSPGHTRATTLLDPVLTG